MSRPSINAIARARADMAACRTALANGSRTFLAASRLLPRRVRDPAIALYAFCREADDAIDIGGANAKTLAALNARLDAIYAGAPAANAADRAFAAVVEDFAIPRALPEALIEGFAWDAETRCYDTLPDVLAYATRVAGSVGAMMALLMRARSPAQLARACDLGIAMQLSNIARDVGEDARAGRLYLPRSWMREAGMDCEAWLARPEPDPRLATVVERLLAAADALYRRAQSGIAVLPVDCRAGIFAACYLYDDIGQQVRRNGYDSVTRRAVVPARRKVELVTRAALAASLSIPRKPIEIDDRVAEAAYLMDAIISMNALADPERDAPAVAWWNLPGRTARIIDIFERLERAERERVAVRAQPLPQSVPVRA